uniref:CHK kinase-like domain-containing protein n=1 Tax=Panagrolaimus sp. JU765 TaxID=591449 RepID=A0AC34QF80_9BILA
MSPNAEDKSCVMETVDLNKKINNSSFTVGWVVDSLRNHDKVFIEKHGARKIKDLTWYDVSGGKGFVSVVLRCTLIFEDSADDADVYTTVIKIPGRESLDHANDKGDKLIDPDNFKYKLTRFHNFECEFYNELAPLLEMPVARTFKTRAWIVDEQQGCIHMEDLTIRGKVMNYYDTFNVTQLKGIIKHVVRMHAKVLTMEPEAWSGKFLDNQDAFDDIGDITKNALQPFKELAKDRCPLAVELTDKYAKFLVSSGFIHYAFSRSYKDLDLQPVCVHGDLWTSNIMMAVDENGDYTNDVAAFVDWQIIHEGSPMDDLARVVTVCADGNVRREVETFLIDFYLENLAKELEGTGVQVPYTADKLQEAYDYMFL